MKVAYIIVLILFSVFCGYFVGKRDNLTVIEMPLPIETYVNNVKTEVISDETENSTLKWQVADNVTLKIVRKRLNSGCEKDFGLNSCEELTILDKNGKRLFHFRDFAFESLQFLNLSR